MRDQDAVFILGHSLTACWSILSPKWGFEVSDQASSHEDHLSEPWLFRAGEPKPRNGTPVVICCYCSMLPTYQLSECPGEACHV